MDSPREVFRRLYRARIKFWVDVVWSGGLDVGIGSRSGAVAATAHVRSLAEAAAWLDDQAHRLFPESACASGEGRVPQAVEAPGELPKAPEQAA
jgi:hypothetical protein